MKKKLLFVLPSLHGGGAERVVLTLLKHLDRNRFEIHLALVSKEGILLKEVPSDVTLHDLKAKRVRLALLAIIKLIRSIKPDTVFTTLSYLNMAVILIRPLLSENVRIVSREAFIVSEGLKYYNFARLWKLLYKIFYKNADLIVCQSDYMLHDLHTNFNIPLEKMVRIYNPVDVTYIHQLMTNAENPFASNNFGPNVLLVGRIGLEKGFERVIKSFPELLHIKKSAQLWILGNGPLEGELKDLSKSLGVGENVHFIGFQENPYRWMAHADLFILSSYQEGLPNVLLEAITCGCSVLALDNPGGTREIMQLTGQEERVLNKLVWCEEWFIKDEKKIHEISEKLADNFNINLIIKQYEGVL